MQKATYSQHVSWFQLRDKCGTAFELNQPLSFLLMGAGYTVACDDLLAWHEVDRQVWFCCLAKRDNNVWEFHNLVGSYAQLEPLFDKFEVQNNNKFQFPIYGKLFWSSYIEMRQQARLCIIEKAQMVRPELVRHIQACTLGSLGSTILARLTL